MVAGRSIDISALKALIDPADLIIAHNAGFDRPFCEAFSPIFAGKAWACSNAESTGRRAVSKAPSSVISSVRPVISTKAIAPSTIVSRLLEVLEQDSKMRSGHARLPSFTMPASARGVRVLPKTALRYEGSSQGPRLSLVGRQRWPPEILVDRSGRRGCSTMNSAISGPRSTAGRMPTRRSGG
jgi:hypothetical protein